MPRYYFDLADDFDTIDQEGRELQNEAEARSTAAYCARWLASASVLEGSLDRSHHIICRDSAGQKLFSVTFGDVVHVAP